MCSPEISDVILMGYIAKSPELNHFTHSQSDDFVFGVWIIIALTQSHLHVYSQECSEL